MSRCILVLNLGSGGNQRGLVAATVSEQVESIFTAAGHQISTSLAAPDRVEQELHRAIDSRPEIILIGGGDGTVSTAARLLGGTGISLGILPMGTFNLAARDLGIPLEIEAAAHFLAQAPSTEIDVLEVAGHTCLCTTILGFYPEFSNIFESRDHGGVWWRKTLKLLINLQRTFSHFRPLRLRWETETERGTSRTKFSAFVPGRYMENAGIIPTRTDFRSGHLTAYIGTHKAPAAALRAIFDYAVGRHEHNPGLHILHARKITLRAGRRRSCKVMLDGEILRLRFPIEMHTVPTHLKVLSARDEIPSP